MAPKKTNTPPKRTVRTRATPMVLSSSDSSRSSSPISSDGEGTGKRVKTDPESSTPSHEQLVLAENKPILEAVEETRLKLKEFYRACLVLRYPLHSSRVYPISWYDELDNLKDFSAILAHQGWKEFLDSSHVIYPVQVAQFWATLRVENRVLCANFGDKAIKITMEEFGEAWGIPCEGVEVFSGAKWAGMHEDEQLAYKTFLDPEAKLSDEVLVSKLSSLSRFLLNFMHATIVPKKGGTQRVDAHENRLLYHLLNGDKVNLPLFIFSHISAALEKLTTTRTSPTLVIPYGMWLSNLLKNKGVVGKNALTRTPTDMMNTVLLRRMNLEGVDVTNKPRQRPGKEKVGEPSENSGGVRVDVGRTEELMGEMQALMISRLEALETRMMGKLDALAVKVEDGGVKVNVESTKTEVKTEGVQGQAVSLEEKLVGVATDLAKTKDDILTSLFSVDYKLGKVRDRVTNVEEDIKRINTHRDTLGKNVGQVVDLFKAHVNPPSQRLAEIVDRLRTITDQVNRTVYLLQLNHHV